MYNTLKHITRKNVHNSAIISHLGVGIIPRKAIYRKQLSHIHMAIVAFEAIEAGIFKVHPPPMFEAYSFGNFNFFNHQHT